ncbi:putative beta-lactamase-related protein [Neofusicoccum parvum]|uniref:Beta-lactamase-related protein n=1 Tax=Neofusicoccum parvum TaxID=310453 RepID=A0ACB5S9X1_9PEZI|nr:putative beta-lactamase-related protein [Neofusicoccum parvum]
MYTIASSTKFITTLAALQCVDNGLLSLDGDIGDVLPEWKNPKILTSFDNNDQPIFVPAKNTVTLRLKEAALPLEWPGIEKVTNLSLGAYMHAHIFAPLHAPDILYHLDQHPSSHARLAATFERDPASGALAAIPDISRPTTDDFGGGGLSGSAASLLAVYAAVLREDPRLAIRPATLREIWTPQLATTHGLESIENVDPGALCGVPRGAAITYGLGGLVNLEDVAGRRRARSVAWSGMRNYYFWIDFESGVAGLQAMHMLPCGDERTVELLERFEEAVYMAAENA